MAEASDETRKRIRWRLVFWFVLVIAASPLVLIFGIGTAVNHVKVDESKVAPPPELAKMLAPKPAVTTETRTIDLTDQGYYQIFREQAHSKDLAQKMPAVFAGKFVNDPNPEGGRKTYLIPWANGPMTSTQIDWVRAHHDAIKTILQYANAPGGIDIDPGEIANHQLMMQLLMADGWVKLHGGRPEGLESYLAIYRLSDKCKSHYEIYADPFIYAGNAMFQNWIEDPSLPKNQAGEMLRRLNQIHEEFYSLERYRKDMRALTEKEYARTRSKFLQTINSQPWKSEFFGFDLNSTPRFGYYYKEFGSGALLPRFDRMLVTTVGAMNRKHNAPEVIWQFDNIWKKALDWPGQSWQGIMNVSRSDWPEFGNTYGQLRNIYVRHLANETMLNLNRAALALIDDPNTTRIAEAATGRLKIQGHEDPWRDPFSGNSLRLMQNVEDAGFRIYSVGPELEERFGMMDYWKSRGIGGAGNIIINVPSLQTQIKPGKLPLTAIRGVSSPLSARHFRRGVSLPLASRPDARHTCG